jgi:hypothetical protein
MTYNHTQHKYRNHQWAEVPKTGSLADEIVTFALNKAGLTAERLGQSGNA